MARRYERSVQYTPTGMDFSRAQTAGQLASVLSSFSQQAGQRYTQARAAAGSQAGSEVTGTPTLKSGFTAFGRAYNDAASRNYLISQYADMEAQLGRAEAESGSDPDKFRAASEGMLRGVQKSAVPQLRGDLAAMYQRRIGEGTVRLTKMRIAEQKELNRAMLQKGLDTVSDSISRKFASGDPVAMQEAEEDEVHYALMVDGALNDGTVTPAEAETLKTEAAKRSTAQILTGMFENQIRVGDPIAFISKVMQQPVANLSDAEKQGVVVDMFQRLNRYQALTAEDEQLQNAEQKSRWKEGERSATLSFLQGGLTIGGLSKMLANDQLDPAIARTLENQLSSPQRHVDDPDVKFQVETNLLSFEEEDIATAPGLSKATRADLILKRREEAEGWRSDPGAQEALRRIDVAIGMPPGGTIMANIDPTIMTKAGRAKSYFYDLIESTPEDQRRGQYIELGQKAIDYVQRDDNAAALERERRTLAQYQAQVGDASQLSGRQLEEYQQTVERRQKRIADLESRLKQ